jgi:signal transduction histidine kinase
MVAGCTRNPRGADALAGVAAAAVLVAITAMGFRDQGVDPIAYPCCAVAGLAFAVRRRSAGRDASRSSSPRSASTAPPGQPGGPVYAHDFLAALNLAVRRPMRRWLPWTAAAAVALSPPTGWPTASRRISSPSRCCCSPRRSSPATRARRGGCAWRRSRRAWASPSRRRGGGWPRERLRIAREVHDVVGHGLATITLRAGVADRLADRDPAEVPRGAARHPAGVEGVARGS